jgi:hypothetical protein
MQGPDTPTGWQDSPALNTQPLLTQVAQSAVCNRRVRAPQSQWAAP